MAELLKDPTLPSSLTSFPSVFDERLDRNSRRVAAARRYSNLNFRLEYNHHLIARFRINKIAFAHAHHICLIFRQGMPQNNLNSSTATPVGCATIAFLLTMLKRLAVYFPINRFASVVVLLEVPCSKASYWRNDGCGGWILRTRGDYGVSQAERCGSRNEPLASTQVSLPSDPISPSSSLFHLHSPSAESTMTFAQPNCLGICIARSHWQLIGATAL